MIKKISLGMVIFLSSTNIISCSAKKVDKNRNVKKAVKLYYKDKGNSLLLKPYLTLFR